MTKKSYIQIAKILSQLPQDIQQKILPQILPVLKSDNQRFNAQKFIDAIEN
jgi:hypothetical protein